MPTYEYACRDCGEHLEVVQSFRDDPLTTCGFCGGDLRKVFSAAGIIFKGSGYYVTDTRKQEKQAAGDGSSKTPSETEGSGGASKAEASGASSSSAGSGKASADAKSA